MNRPLAILKNSVTPPGRRRCRVVWGLNHGLVMHLDLREDLQRLFGLYERELSGFFRSYAEKINTAIDVGAGEGFYTLFFLARTSARKVIVFEPDPAARALIESNIEANELRADRLTLYSDAVGARPQDGFRELDSLLGQIIPPCLIKIDVEGAETEVLAGASALLSVPDIVWVIETHSLRSEEVCSNMLEVTGHRTAIVRNAWWRSILPELRPIEHNRWIFANSVQ